MSDDKFQVQTWIRRNREALEELGAPQKDLAELFGRRGLQAILVDSDGQDAEGVEDLARVHREGRALVVAARSLRGLRPVPDLQAQDLLTSSLDAYAEVGALLASQDRVDADDAARRWEEAGDIFLAFAQRLRTAADS